MGKLEWVRPLQGTDSRREFSTGNTLPLVGVPRGLTYFTAQTSDRDFAFDRQGAKLAGFRATHMPSPWMNDFGHFDIMPVVGDIRATAAGRASAYRVDQAKASPNCFSTQLLRYNVGVRMTATRACGVFEFAFPKEAGDRASVVIQTGGAPHGDGEMRFELSNGRAVLVGRSSANHSGVAGDFACHFVIEIQNADLVGNGVIDDAGLHDGVDRVAAKRAGVYLRLKPTGPVIVRVGTSFISPEQAKLNLSREVSGKSFDDVARTTGDAWESWLSRVEADGGSDSDRVCLYTALYRVGLFPMAMHEFDEQGNTKHYSPYDGRVHSGVAYTNNGFWDTYRTVYPLLSIIDREGFGEIIEGFLQAYRQGGWLPRWCSPGYRDCMIGSHADVVIAVAVAHGIDGFDVAEAYEAIRKSAFVQPDRPGVYGRAALNDYIRLGYVPNEAAKYSVSWTLDNAHCDWCIAQVAKKVGRNDDAAALMKRTKNYRNLWHAESRLMRPKNADGSWAEPWREFQWGGPYVEGGPWQHSMHVPHDLPGLAELHGSRTKLVARVEEMLTTPAHFDIGYYGDEIHEMTEMALAFDADGKSFGQYAQSNQPVHAFLWIPAALGVPDVTARHVRHVMKSLYTPDRLPGDEDNGEMSAWYVLGAMNKFPACAGSGQFVEAPVNVFDQVRVVRR
ncbi:MAG: GH92 family glycosyl hydrolase [Tepidisphaeraceae bacterium]